MRRPVKASRVYKFEQKRNFQIAPAPPSLLLIERRQTEVKPREQQRAIDGRSADVEAAADLVVDVKEAQERGTVVVGEGLPDEARADIVQFASFEDPDVGCHIEAVAGAGDFELVGEAGQIMGTAGVRGTVPHGSFVFEVRLRIVWPPCPRIGSVGRERTSLLDALQG